MTLDLTTLTKVDPNNRLSLSTSTITFTAVPYSESTYAYADYGVGGIADTAYFEGQFNISSSGLSNGSSLIMGFGSAASNFGSDLNSLGVILQGNASSIFTVYADINQGGIETDGAGSATINPSTNYYYRIGFYSGLGRYGANYVQIFSDSGRTTLVSKAINQRTVSQVYRYFYPFRSVGSGLTSTITGTNANITVTKSSVGLDQTTFTKVDPNTHGAVYSDVSVLTTLGTNETAYLYKDYGSGYATGNFAIRGLLNVTAFASGAGQMANLLSFVNTLGQANSTNDLQGIALVWASSSTFNLKAREVSGGTEYLSTASSTLSTSTPYWIEISRDKSVGAFGTLYVKVFSDPGYSVQVGSTVSITLHATVAWRYLNAWQSYNASTATSSTLTLGTILANISTVVPATVSWTQADDTVSANGVSKTATSVAFTQADNTVAVTGVKNAPIMQVNVVQADNTIEATATQKNIGAISVTQGGDSVAANGAVPGKANIAFTQSDNVVAAAGALHIILEPFTVKVRHKTTGAPITGLTTVTLAAEQPETGYRLDFSDGVFKSSPSQPILILSEVDAVNQPGLYRSVLVTTAFSGWVDYEATYNDGSYIYAYGGEAFYSNGQRTNGALSAAQQNQLDNLTTMVSTIGGNPWSQVIESGLTASQVMRILSASLVGKVSGAGTGTETFKGVDGTTNRVVSVVDSNGNRLSVTLNGT